MVSTFGFDPKDGVSTTSRPATSLIIKGGFTMTELAITNRIALLESRKTDNKRIVDKLKRQLRALQNTTK